MTVDNSVYKACSLLSHAGISAHNCALIMNMTQNDMQTERIRPTAAQVWGIGLLFVTLISSCAAIGIGLMPLLNRHLYHRALTYFVGLGVGSLSGSAVFHLLPQAFDLLSNGDHAYLNKAWVVIAGIYMFFFVDKFLKVIMDYRKYHGGRLPRILPRRRKQPKNVPLTGLTITGTDGATDDLLMDTNRKEKQEKVVKFCEESDNSPNEEQITNGDDKSITVNGNGHLPRESSDNESSTGVSTIVENQTHAMCAHDHNFEYDATKHTVIGTVAWMIIFGDGLHNLIDGLSIGAAFSESILSGISISVAVLCEEFPHELGDVAILINAGMSLRQALTYNLMSAATCYLGFVMGVLLGEMANAQVYIFALAGGMFLYISLASMVPEMNTVMEVQMEKSMSRGIRVLLLQAAGVFTGLMLMYIMSLYGSNITFE